MLSAQGRVSAGAGSLNERSRNLSDRSQGLRRRPSKSSVDAIPLDEILLHDSIYFLSFHG